MHDKPVFPLVAFVSCLLAYLCIYCLVMNCLLIEYNVYVGCCLFACFCRYIKKIYPHDDPRNLPNNPHLNIPRALMSEDGGSVSTSSDMGSGTGRRGGGTEKTLDGLDALESAVGPGEIRHPFPFLSDPDGASTRKVHSSSLFSYSSSTDQDTMERPLLTGAESQSYSHSQSRHSSPRVATDRRTLSDFSVENTVDSPQVLSQRKHISSNEIEDVSEL